MTRVFQPENLSSLSPLNFSMVINKIPTVSYFGQAVTLPDMTLGSTYSDSPFLKIPIPGDHITFSEVSIKFLVDEDMVNWLEIYNWMVGLGFPENFEQYATLRNNDRTNLYSDGVLLLYTGSKIANIEVSFKQMFPVSLGGLIFRTTDNDVNYFEASASFKFAYYTLKKL